MKAKKGKYFARGAHIPDKKSYTENKPIEIMDSPELVSISLAQHIGKPAECIVQKGDYVYQGQLIGRQSGYVSANVYSSVSGEVVGVETRPNVVGAIQNFVVIRNDKHYQSVSLEPMKDYEPKSIINRVNEAGIVGMGGAGFPTSIKLSPPVPVDMLVINGAECEPYLTCDYRLMIEKTEEVYKGIKLLARALNVKKIYLGIELNKPKAIALYEKYDDIQVIKLKKRYPMGSEKHLIYCCTGRKVPLGKLPADSGCVVQNIATAFATYEAVMLNKPLYERVMTVSGESIIHPRNLLVKFGTRFEDILNYSGWFSDDLAMLVNGGPMMGPAMLSNNFYTTKTNSGLLALTASEADMNEPTACLNCGKCAKACTMKLLPMMIDFYSQAGEYEKAAKYGGVKNCISCGSCAYVCPAKRALVQSITLAKTKLREIEMAKKEG